MSIPAVWCISAFQSPFSLPGWHQKLSSSEKASSGMTSLNTAKNMRWVTESVTFFQSQQCCFTPESPNNPSSSNERGRLGLFGGPQFLKVTKTAHFGMKENSEIFSYKVLFYHRGPEKRNNLTELQSWPLAEFKQDKDLLTSISGPVIFHEALKKHSS